MKFAGNGLQTKLVPYTKMRKHQVSVVPSEWLVQWILEAGRTKNKVLADSVATEGSICAFQSGNVTVSSQGKERQRKTERKSEGGRREHTRPDVSSPKPASPADSGPDVSDLNIYHHLTCLISKHGHTGGKDFNM